MVQVKKKSTMTGHRDCVYTLAKAPVDDHFFSAAGDGMVVLWDLNDPENGQLIARVPNSVYSITFHAISGLLCVGHNYEGIHFIDWKKRKEKGSLKCTDGSLFSLHADGDLLYAGDSEGQIHIIHVAERRIMRSVQQSAERVRSMTIDHSLGHLAAGYSDNRIRIFKLPELELLAELDAHTNSVFSVRFSPDGRFLYSAGRDAHIRQYSTENNYEEVNQVVGHMYTINNLEFSPDGKHFVTCSMDKSIKVWEAASLKLLKVIDKARHAGHGTSVNKLLWMDDGKTLISASDDRTISAWDIEFN